MGNYGESHIKYFHYKSVKETENELNDTEISGFYFIFYDSQINVNSTSLSWSLPFSAIKSILSCKMLKLLLWNLKF